MTRPWPVTENEFLLDDALDIAMRYFDLPPDSAEYAQRREVCGRRNHG